MKNSNELHRRLDALEKRQKDLERMFKGLPKKKAAPKKTVKKKAGEASSSEIVEKKKE